MNSNEFLLNNATIENQPKQNFHYRYVSELLGNTHGAVSGQYDDYPKIKLLLPENGFLDNFGNKRDFFVLCSLHCYDNKVLSPHLLMQKKETELNYNFIFEKMEEVHDNPIERFWKLREYVIVRLTAANYKTSFQKKQAQYQDLNLPLQFENILGQLNLNDTRKVKDSGKLNVCLGFRIFEKDFYNNTYSLYRGTIFSCNIYHGDDLRIHRLCNTKGSVFGGTEVTVLIRVEPNFPLNVAIKRIDDISKETLWSTMVEIKKNNIFGNAAVTFTMPPYRGPVSAEDEIEIFICLTVGNTTYKSNAVRYYYINEKANKRRRYVQDDHSIEDKAKLSKVGNVNDYVSFDNVSMAMPLDISFKKSRHGIVCIDIKSKIDEVFKNLHNPDSKTSYSYIDAIFYEALGSTDAFIHLYKAANDSNKKYLVANFRNENRENLLHWACKMNHFSRIRPLIGLGCHINEQDNMGRTPLHVALANQHTDCMSEIQNLINDHSQYPKEVNDNFIKMFKAYNHDGHTVLHEAALGEFTGLFEIMLIFFNKHNMNALDYEVLGSGDSIVLLAAKNNLIDILLLVKKYIPNYSITSNYAGLTFKDFQENAADSNEAESDEMGSDEGEPDSRIQQLSI